ncbi:metallophosphoesterase [Tuwongella immobilis]|uniref:Calcineurin-like phosphoesterase domain-containing protein n=1 Tax=Tuwongella immobilis TaxID=692036 RepID=A0A6C2YTT1_9BACT|nr:metallophosphoesterase [Tuwongella immobilis]VIP05148.1 metallophosphoesterase : Metallophosphoesterase OS=Clostridium thermocellum (strain DSM 1313 / LMG 6656 / LQ8) GN=Clo1313_2828 PE=4 SV=1: Metallophos [Tuwongella immobilis]VTS07652.1 metallophosphoesterase : Metallophosphoesterase OS=Clostridium thermocellum (strain DSM 1313 / LMG 6656 / LQ8) GN=Clo1313_2828 PE=4 SV=1: Metallophos [Tuwongella immobilis]
MDVVPVNVQPTRRKFLRRMLCGGAALAGLTGLGVGYGFWEASQIRIRRQIIALPRLPQAFVGKTIAVMGDFHHGPFVSIAFIREAVAIAQQLNADAYALVGDFAHKGTDAAEQLPPCLEALSALRAPLGVFAVPGNHDLHENGRLYREIIGATTITDLTNRSIRLSIGSDSLCVAGVDDLWWGKPDLHAALHNVPEEMAVILLAHNPDFAEVRPDSRVGLMLSGHTHGGQAYVPGLGSAWLPSKFGDKYRSGLVDGPQSQVFVTRGLGEAGVPIRFNCPPEINLLTLTQPS